MEKARHFDLKASLIAMTIGFASATSAMAQSPPTSDLVDKVVSAKTRADHEYIAAEFGKQAGIERSNAERHRKMANLYKSPAWSKASGAGMVKHCESLVRAYESAARDNDAMARMHRDIGSKLP
jgi:hypothetical protein